MNIKVKNINVNFKIYNPGGNITAIVMNADYDKQTKKVINDCILKKYSFVEQVGFMKDNNLEMAGDEFCINASRCAIYYLLGTAKSTKLKILDKEIYGEMIEKNILSIRYNVGKKIDFFVKKDNDNYIINLDGICLVFLNEEENKKYLKMINRNDIKAIIKERLNSFKLYEKAKGIILTSCNDIYPFILVEDIDTLFFETACGSASVAYTLLNFVRSGNTNCTIMQPSGYSLNVKLETKNGIIKDIICVGYVEEYNEEKLQFENNI